jgi:hypothetical protein
MAFVTTTAVPAAAAVRFEVGGAVESAGGALDVRVDMTNSGETAAATVDVRGELGDAVDQLSIEGGVPAGATRSVRFHFETVPPRPGIHVLGLRLDYTEEAARGRTVTTASQRAFLLLSIGANPPPALRVSAGESSLETSGAVKVTVESADRAPHRVRLSVLTPRGLNANTPVEMDVPATGPVSAAVSVLRGSVPRPSRQGVLVVAEAMDGDLAQAAVATTVVDVEGDPAWLPRLRQPIAGAAIALLLAAGVLEWRARGRAVRPPSS